MLLMKTGALLSKSNSKILSTLHLIGPNIEYSLATPKEKSICGFKVISKGCLRIVLLYKTLPILQLRADFLLFMLTRT